MFCASCRSEYRAGISNCPECQVPLVEVLPEAGDPGHEMAYVRVLETTDPVLLPMVKSIFEAAQIPISVEGEEALGVLPVGGFGTGERMHGLGARVFVPLEHEAAARELLAELDRPGSQEE